MVRALTAATWTCCSALERTFDPATQLIDYDVARFKYSCEGAQLMRRFLV